MDSVYIEVGPVWARLRGPSAQLTYVREAFTVDVPGAEYTPQARYRAWDGKTRFVKQGDVILSGLVWRCAGYLMKGGFPKPDVLWSATPQKPPLVEKSVDVRAYQEPVIQKMQRVRRMGVQMPTGAGKTLTAIEAARRIGERTLWLTHTKELLAQTVSTFENSLGIKCGILGSGKEIEGDGRVVVATIQTLTRMLRAAPDVVKPWLSDFGCVIADEGHHASADSWQEIFNACTGAHYRFALSATLDTGNEVNNLKIEGVTGPTWIVESVASLAGLGWLAKPRVVMLSVSPKSYPSYEQIRDIVCPTWEDNPRQLRSLGGKLFSETYERGIVNNKDRNAKIVEVIRRHVQVADKMLVLVSRIPHMMSLVDTVRSEGLSVMGLDGGATDAARTEAFNLFKAGLRGRALIATPFAREGIDLPQIDVGMLAGGGLSDVVVMQGFGRMLRKRRDKDEVLIYDFVDGGAPSDREDKDYLAEHSKSRLGLYVNQGFTVERE